MRAIVRQALEVAALVGPEEPAALDLLAEILMNTIVDTYGPEF